MIDSKKIKNNPNQKAKIGFLCDYPFHYYVYKNIYRYLPNSEFILTNEIYPFSNYYDNRLLEMISFFENKRVYWKIFHKKISYPADFFSKYEILVSPLYRGCIAREYNKDKKKVRVLYGPGKDLIDFGIGNCYFDLILTYGKYSQRHLRPYAKTRMVGYPKFDDWFNGNIDKGDLNYLRKRINPNKKTILYVPTYGNLSSMDDFRDKITELTKYFNLIIKFHHISLWDEEKKIKKFLNNRKIISSDKEKDILPLFFLADVVVSDNSGAIFEAVLTDKPVVLLGKLDKGFLEKPKSLRVKRKYLQPALTYADSIEQRIRKPGKEIGIVVEKGDDLEKAVRDSIGDNSIIVKRRKELKDSLFSCNDGKSGYRAAQEIKGFLDGPKPKEKFLAIAVKSYISNFKKNLKHNMGKLNK